MLHTSFWFDADSSPFTENSILTMSNASCAVEVVVDPVVVTYDGVAIDLPADGAERCFFREGGSLVPMDPQGE